MSFTYLVGRKGFNCVHVIDWEQSASRRDAVSIYSCNPFSVKLPQPHQYETLHCVARDRLSLDYLMTFPLMSLYIKKGKAIPLQAWTGPEGSRRLRFPDFKTIDT